MVYEKMKKKKYYNLVKRVRIFARWFRHSRDSTPDSTRD